MWNIYSRKNKITSQEYIGKTVQSLTKRAGKDGSQYCRKHGPLGQAIEEYGWSNFKSELLETCETEEQANKREQYYIRTRNTLWPNGYNRESGGRHFEHHEETKELMKTSQQKRRKSEPNKTRKVGPRKTYETGIVQRFTKDGQLVAEYPSIEEAHRQTGINAANIGSCCKGNLKSAGGYFWMRKKDTK